jgi:hypothetical protein
VLGRQAASPTHVRHLTRHLLLPCGDPCVGVPYRRSLMRTIMRHDECALPSEKADVRDHHGRGRAGGVLRWCLADFWPCCMTAAT